MDSKEQIEAWKRSFVEKGPAQVREDLDRELYGPHSNVKAKLARTFLESCEAEEQSRHRGETVELAGEANTLAEKANDLATEANLTANEANQISKSAKTWARWAVIIAGFVFVMQLIQWWLTLAS